MSSQAAGLTATSDRPFAADIDGDGVTDLIVWRPNDGTWHWLTSSSGYQPAAAGTAQWGSQAQGDIPFVADIDGDGKADFIVWRGSTGRHWLTSSTGYNPAAAGSRQWGNRSLGDIPPSVTSTATARPISSYGAGPPARGTG